MCGRYYVDDETAREIEKLVREIDSKIKRESLTGDVYPSSHAMVLVEKDRQVVPAWQRWGLPGFQSKGVIFNARSESVLEKPMFRESILRRRAVIPCSGFYEWSKNKEKAAFYREGFPVMFLAGFYNQEEEDQFVILTTKANPFVAPVHDRMPLILEKSEIKDWLSDEEAFRYMLAERQIPLKRHQEYEQQQLKLF
ncbi:SOS response-associated peptidase [Clostridium boliviensis]|uniref:Abasic site processing protein n=1 Tax=Clostridium boliviensis TaxID=318465 RepID=A0ABU4GH37_9CLOT|nr:SOS response-associated peptidase [Clostridium boliviensis]MDW2796926.1 SOS response-associated peptidase [Clostridium boliviensis]